MSRDSSAHEGQQAWLVCCRAFPDAIAQRCFFFEPSDAHVAEDKTEMPELMMFPPTESGTPHFLALHAHAVFRTLEHDS